MASSRFVLGVFLSGGFHVLAFVHMSHAKASAKPPPPPVVIEVDTSLPVPPPPSPHLPPAPSAPPPDTDSSPAKAARSNPSSTAPARSAEPAQAAKTLTASDDAPPAMADFTMIQGGGAAYAGGVTTSAGTNRTASDGAERMAVLAPPRDGSSGGGGGDGRGTGSDRSKPARPVGSDWDCKALFPAGATVDDATVVIVARVRADGTPESVGIVGDPGQGFGAAARACAMRQRYAAAADRSGHAVSASTAPFRVRFTR